MMFKIQKAFLYSFIIILFILFSLPFTVHSEIIVYDTIIPKNKIVMLRAETKDHFFKKGGKLVEFFVDGQSIGKTLSGGDGIAYMQFKPIKSGLYHIRVKSEKEEDNGLLLSLKRNEGLIFVDIEGSLWEGVFSQKPRKESRETIKKLSKRFPVVFLQTSFLGIKNAKKWLKENSFVELPVVRWKRGLIFDEIIENGLKIKALIGSASVINSAKNYNIEKLISFDEVEGAELVKDWNEIKKKIEILHIN